MQKQSSSETTPSALQPTVPTDVAARSQRARIIDAMVVSCAEKTYTATTISDIVAGASISRTTFYKRFRGKRDCFDAALDSCIEQLRATAGAAVSSSDSPPEAVRKTSAALLELLAAKPQLAQVLAAEAVSVDPAVVRRYRRLLIPALEDLWNGGGESPRGHTSPGLAVGRVQLLILNQIANGRPDRLTDLQPEIVYLALAPFVGHEEAVREARPADQSERGNRKR
jgi:AcrR family transcriptional regulator